MVFIEDAKIANPLPESNRAVGRAGQLKGATDASFYGYDYPTAYIAPSSTQFTWYPQGVGTYRVSVVPFIDMGSTVQHASFTTTVTPGPLPLITRDSRHNN